MVAGDLVDVLLGIASGSEWAFCLSSIHCSIQCCSKVAASGMESGVRWPDLTNVFTCLSLMYTTYQRRSPHFLCYVAPIPGSPGNARLSQVISGQSYWLGVCVCVSEPRLDSRV